jgi:hypothetical protein
MKRWAVVTIGLYLAALVLVSLPALGAYLALATDPVHPAQFDPVAETLAVVRHSGYWLFMGLCVAGQALLLVVPVAASERRPRSRRRLLVPVITSAFLLALVAVTALYALDAAIWGDNARLLLLFGDTDFGPVITAVLLLVLAWVGWGVLFHRFAAATDREALTRRLMRWLLRGSILELLIAVPSHVLARRRHDCCAPLISFWGIATGITVMLLSFGPGVYFLFVERVRRKTQQRNPAG